MRLALVLVLVAGCRDDVDMFPITPGGGSGGSGGTVRPDAAVDAVDALAAIDGRVCLLLDTRDLLSCAGTGAGGLTVMLGPDTTTTDDDGRFTLPRTTDQGTTWSVTGPGIVPSAISLSAIRTLPAIASVQYDDMLQANQAIVVGGNGALIARLTRAGTPLAGLTVAVQPVPDSAIYYDGASPPAWEQNATGPFGTTWISSLVTGPAQLTVNDGSAQTAITGVPVLADTITYVFAEIP